MANIKIRTTYDAVSPLIRAQPESIRELRIFRTSDDAFSAYVLDEVLDFIREQARLGGKNEAIGLLAGRICHDPRTGPYTLVMAAGEARVGEFRASPSFVRLLPEGHKGVRRRLGKAHPDREIVGWYHTHPHYQPNFSAVDFEEQRKWDDENQIGIVYGTVHQGEPFGVYRGPLAVPLHPVRVTNRLREEEENDPVTEVEIRPVPSLIVPRSESSASIRPPQASLGGWYRRSRTVLASGVAFICLGLAFVLFSFHRRVSVTERQIHELVNTREASDGVNKRAPNQASSTSGASPGADLPESIEKVNRIHDPELRLPVKPLTPQSKPGPQSQAQTKTHLRANTAKKKPAASKVSKNKFREVTPPQRFSSPGEQIPFKAGPKPSLKPA